MSSVISLQNAVRRFGKTAALDDVSWEVPAGAVFALLGENGAGKTTSIRALLGLESLDSGRAQVLGFDSQSQGIEIRRRVGYVPEQPVLYDWMTVNEIGWFTSGFYGETFAPKYHQLIADFKVPVERRIRDLSKGMRAEVSLALALAHEPQVLILDEPTSGLDTLVRRRFLESMVDWAASGRTVLLSSHQIGEVERVADVVAIMQEGRILLCERLEQLKTRLEQWTISLAEGQTTLPDLDVETILVEQRGRQFQAMVSQPPTDALWRWREHPAISHIEVHVPSLEEIFVTYLRRSSDPSAEAANPGTRQETSR
ncbi:MAG TPA: ABC transporter ATP-binding protein [Pirellulaceae bacterium]|nr:ABC transporter ATP-binding protein [Pirellulaceae bacterium]